MHSAHIRTVPNLGQLMFATLIHSGLLAAGLAWSMFR